MKKRILFVDDDPKVLEGLGRMLYSMRAEWELLFAPGGHEALEMLAREPVDLIVSDMRMPVMNGLEFLTEVRARYPNIIRVILSGYADQGLIVRSVGVTHQYLSKPCDAEVLRSTLARAFNLRSLLGDERIQPLISRMSTLPSPPSLYMEVVEELQSPDTSVRRVGEIIARDPGMTAKILQLTNSAFFGIRRRVANPAEAATYIGLETIQSLVLSVKAFEGFVATGFHHSVAQIWSHSLATGVLAKRIAEAEHAGKGTVDEAFTAGLLHDLGKLVLACNLPVQYGEAIDAAAKKRIALWDSERAKLGASHAQVGAYLLGLWGLPDPIIEAVALHHDPGACHEREFATLAIVHAANALDSEVRECWWRTNGASDLDLEYVAAIGKAGRLEAWRALRLDETPPGEAP